jgi:transketolase
MRLENLYCVVDVNNFQQTGSTMGVSGNHEIGGAFKSFGWLVEYADGHNLTALNESLNRLKNHPHAEFKPKVVIARTIKGKGLPALEGSNVAHHVSLTKEKYLDAIEFLRKTFAQQSEERLGLE